MKGFKFGVKVLIAGAIVGAVMGLVVDRAYKVQIVGWELVGWFTLLIISFIIGALIIDATPLTSRAWAIAVCISAHKTVRNTTTDRILLNNYMKRHKSEVLAYYTGCYSYIELYTYARKIAYYKR